MQRTALTLGSLLFLLPACASDDLVEAISASDGDSEGALEDDDEDAGGDAAGEGRDDAGHDGGDGSDDGLDEGDTDGGDDGLDGDTDGADDGSDDAGDDGSDDAGDDGSDDAGDDEEEEDEEDDEEDDTGTPSCDPHEATLVAGHHHDAGLVIVTQIAGALVVELEADAGWEIGLVHVYAGTEAPPQSAGAFVPGQFPYAQQLSPAQSWAELVIDLSDLEIACGDLLQIAVHAEVSTCGGAQEETAWAQGPITAQASWGMAFEVALCC